MSRCARVRDRAWVVAAALLVAEVWVGAPRCAHADAPGKPAPRQASAAPKSAAPAAKAPYAATPKHPGVLRLKRAGKTVTVTLVKDGQVTADGAEGLAEVMKHRSGAKHAVDGALAMLLASVSDHFGGKVIDVVDGFRPPPGHSNHNTGKAIDLRVEGVPIEVVRDYCQSLDGAGVGFYPAGKYVHLDARKRGRTWTEESPSGHGEGATASTQRRTTGSPKTPSKPPQPAGTTKKH